MTDPRDRTPQRVRLHDRLVDSILSIDRACLASIKYLNRHRDADMRKVVTNLSRDIANDHRYLKFDRDKLEALLEDKLEFYRQVQDKSGVYELGTSLNLAREVVCLATMTEKRAIKKAAPLDARTQR